MKFHFHLVHFTFSLIFRLLLISSVLNSWTLQSPKTCGDFLPFFKNIDIF